MRVNMERERLSAPFGLERREAEREALDTRTADKKKKKRRKNAQKNMAQIRVSSPFRWNGCARIVSAPHPPPPPEQREGGGSTIAVLSSRLARPDEGSGVLWNARANTRTLREWTGTGGVGEEGEGTSSPQQCHLWVQGIFRLVGGFACVSRCAPRFLTTVCVLLYTAWPGTTPNTLCTSNGDVMVDARRCTYYPVSLGRRSLVMMDRGLVRRPKCSCFSTS